MNYLIAILILVVFIGIYLGAYLVNQKTKKPENCQEIDCHGCNFNCHKGGKDDGSIY